MHIPTYVRNASNNFHQILFKTTFKVKKLKVYDAIFPTRYVRPVSNYASILRPKIKPKWQILSYLRCQSCLVVMHFATMHQY